MNFIIKTLKKRVPFVAKYQSIITEILSFVGIIVFIVIPIRMFIAQPFRVNGDSMINTFHNNDYLIVDEISYRFTQPKRGDVIVLRHPNGGKYLIKRIIGLPEETVTINGSLVSIKNSAHPEGFVLDESFLDYPAPDSFQEYTVPEKSYFVMGDNRPYSSDSRIWGVLPRDRIVGRALLRLYPFTNIDVFPGKIDTYSTQ